MGKLVLYRRDSPLRIPGYATVSWDTLLEFLELKTIAVMDFRRARQFVLVYPGGVLTTESVYEALHTRFAKFDLVMCVGELSTHDIVVFIKKRDMKNITDFAVDGTVPVVYTFVSSGAHARTMDQSMTVVGQAMGNVISELLVQVPTGEFSFEQLMDGIAKLTKERVETLKGTILVKPVKTRSTFELSFLRATAQMVKVKQLRSKGSLGLTFSAYDPPFPVIPLEFLIGLNQKGTRLQEVARTIEEHVLFDLFANPGLLAKHAALILGGNTTTGYGKTQFALRLACEWAKVLAESRGLSKDAAQVVFMNSLDAAKDVEFKPGMALVLDEFCPSDSESLVYVSENILKVLLCPSVMGTIRARNNEIKLCEGVARIITANASSAAAWCGPKIKYSEPLRRKSIVFQITTPLCDPRWVSGLVGSDSSRDPAIETASDLMQARLASAGLALPVQIVPAPSGLASLLCPARR